MSHALIRTGAALVLLVVGASCSDDAVSAPTTSEARTDTPTTPTARWEDRFDSISSAEAAPLVEFTACVNPGPNVQDGSEELTEVSAPDGEMTIARTPGATSSTAPFRRRRCRAPADSPGR
jgi:hypothetical protein